LEIQKGAQTRMACRLKPLAPKSLDKIKKDTLSVLSKQKETRVIKRIFFNQLAPTNSNYNKIIYLYKK
jgi:hypothetical protein